MDIQLPVMDGYEATRRIKADPALKSIPIIAVTSYALSGEEKKARAAGCDEYVPKPLARANCWRKFANTCNSGSQCGLDECPLSGVSGYGAGASAYDPLRTSAVPLLL